GHVGAGRHRTSRRNQGTFTKTLMIEGRSTPSRAGRRNAARCQATSCCCIFSGGRVYAPSQFSLTPRCALFGSSLRTFAGHVPEGEPMRVLLFVVCAVTATLAGCYSYTSPGASDLRKFGYAPGAVLSSAAPAAQPGWVNEGPPPPPGLGETKPETEGG